ncbi:hypothetical protein H1C71_007615 [Ictidomys tridecemlineatus]|nr:hypothetical protein H1C71_007615 [Ictidomys tridecemlineatus]
MIPALRHRERVGRRCPVSDTVNHDGYQFQCELLSKGEAARRGLQLTPQVDPGGRSLPAFSILPCTEPLLPQDLCTCCSLGWGGEAEGGGLQSGGRLTGAEGARPAGRRRCCPAPGPTNEGTLCPGWGPVLGQARPVGSGGSAPRSLLSWSLGSRARGTQPRAGLGRAAWCPVVRGRWGPSALWAPPVTGGNAHPGLRGHRGGRTAPGSGAVPRRTPCGSCHQASGGPGQLARAAPPVPVVLGTPAPVLREHVALCSAWRVLAPKSSPGHRGPGPPSGSHQVIAWAQGTRATLGVPEGSRAAAWWTQLQGQSPAGGSGLASRPPVPGGPRGGHPISPPPPRCPRVPASPPEPATRSGGRVWHQAALPRPQPPRLPPPGQGLRPHGA